jgi:hypothetical protein
MAVSRILVTVSARLHVVDSTPPAAMHAQRPAMGISHVGFAWSRAKFGAASVARSAMSLVFLASKIAPGPVHIGERANCHARCHVICFHVPDAARRH